VFSERVQKMIADGISYPLAKKSETEDKEYVKMCSNENPYGPSPRAMEAVKEAASDIEKYPKSGSLKLKKAISDYAGVEYSQVCVGNGSDEIMDLLEKATMDPGDEALIPIPTFSQYELSCRANAMSTKFVELGNFEWDADKLVEEIESSKIAFLGRPNNPTGNSINRDGLKDLLETGKIIVVDEAYAEFSEESVIDLVDEYENLVVLRTFSKMFGLAGLRIGYGLANEKLVEGVERVRPPFSVNKLAQSAAVEALKDEEFVEKTKTKISSGRSYLEEELKDLGFEVLPSKANFIMTSPAPIGFDSSKVCEYLSREKGILIRDLSGFRGISSDWVRITVGKPKQNKRLIKGLKELKEVENDD